jgi:hypothetical protein
MSGGAPAIGRSMSNSAPMRSSASFAIFDWCAAHSSKKPRLTCDQQPTSATRGGPGSSAASDDLMPAIS